MELADQQVTISTKPMDIMRILITCSVIAALMLSFTTSAEAQLGKRLKERAKRAAARKAEEKVAAELERKAEQMVEKSWDSIFGDLEESAKDGRNFMFNLNSNVTTEDTYRFDTITTMQLETIKENGKSDPPMFMEMHFNKDQMYTGTKFRGEDLQQENADVFIIYDFKNSAMVMLMSSEKDKFSFAYDWQQALKYAESEETADGYETEGEDEEEVDWENVEEWNGYTRIGTKKIAGYSSDGYRSETDQTVTELWVTRDAAYGMNNMFQANANAKQLRGKLPEDYPYGMLMEMVSENVKNGEKTVMRVTDIRENMNISYAMSDYPNLSLGQKGM